MNFHDSTMERVVDGFEIAGAWRSWSSVRFLALVRAAVNSLGRAGSPTSAPDRMSAGRSSWAWKY